MSNRIALPSKQEMTEDVRAFYSSLEAAGKPKRHTHDISDSQVISASLLPCQFFSLIDISLIITWHDTDSKYVEYS